LQYDEEALISIKSLHLTAGAISGGFAGFQSFALSARLVVILPAVGELGRYSN